MPKLSLLIHTASYDDFLQAQGMPSYFVALVDNLEHQTFKDLELVYVDTFYDRNREPFAKVSSDLSFVVKHVPVHKDHRYWYDKGFVYIAAAKNTGLLYADGELCVTCDDSEFFPEHLMERYWSQYQSGVCLLALHKRMTHIDTENGLIKHPISGGVYVNDHRVELCNQPMIHDHGSWTFAGMSYSLSDALDINGFNERLDGCKSLDDCDFGTRLGMLGRKFFSSHEDFIYLVDHPHYGGDTKTTGPDAAVSAPGSDMRVGRRIDNLIAVENHGLLRCAVELMEPRANGTSPLTDMHWKIIQRETIKHQHFDPLAEDNKFKLDLWKGVQGFDMKAQRAELRRSPEWIWG